MEQQNEILNQVPPINRDRPRSEIEKDLKKYERKTFLWPDSKEKDMRYFKEQIILWLKDQRDEESYTKLIWAIIYEVNDEGRTCKYLYFNEYVQKLYIDRDAYEWFKLIIKLIEEDLEKYEVEVH